MAAAVVFSVERPTNGKTLRRYRAGFKLIQSTLQTAERVYLDVTSALRATSSISSFELLVASVAL
jgi:hypothetical protein